MQFGTGDALTNLGKLTQIAANRAIKNINFQPTCVSSMFITYSFVADSCSASQSLTRQ